MNINITTNRPLRYTVFSFTFIASLYFIIRHKDSQERLLSMLKSGDFYGTSEYLKELKRAEGLDDKEYKMFLSMLNILRIYHTGISAFRSKDIAKARDSFIAIDRMVLDHSLLFGLENKLIIQASYAARSQTGELLDRGEFPEMRNIRENLLKAFKASLADDNCSEIFKILIEANIFIVLCEYHLKNHSLRSAFDD